MAGALLKKSLLRTSANGWRAKISKWKLLNPSKVNCYYCHFLLHYYEHFFNKKESDMDGEAILAIVDMGQEALAPMIPSFGKRLKIYTLLKREIVS
jgi:hypothetical protein